MYSAEELRQDARLYKGELFLQLGFAAPTRAEGETTQVGTTRGSAPAGLSVDAPDAPPSASPAVVGDARPIGNILGAGYGLRVADGGASAEELAVRVYVRTKFPFSQLSLKDRVPARINGRDTEVIAIGDVVAARCGGSCGHPNGAAGTLGCIVEDAAGVRYILSNNHVLAALDGPIGSDVYRPGPLDGGTGVDKVAELTAFHRIDFGAGVVNRIDAAIAELIPQDAEDPEIRTIGRVGSPFLPAALFQSVRKHGRSTGHKVGVINDVSADLWVNYGARRAWFEDQLGIAGMASDPLGFGQPGDSGSLVVEAGTKRPVGLLFAVSGAQAFANPIEPILRHFKVTVV